MLKNLLEEVIEKIQDLGQDPNLKSGKQKKAFLLLWLRRKLPMDNEIEELILFIVEKLIDVENDKLRINKKISRNCCGF